MKQVIQSVGDGSLRVVEVPAERLSGKSVVDTRGIWRGLTTGAAHYRHVQDRTP